VLEEKISLYFRFRKNIISKKGAKSLSDSKALSTKDYAQDCHLAHFWRWSQAEKLSEIKPPLMNELL
jgi:hypothetical protein